MLLLSKKLDSRPLAYREYIVVDVAIWHYLDARYAHRKGELLLESVEQIIGYVIDNGWLILLLEHLVFWFRTHDLELYSRECNEDSMIVNFQPCKFTSLSRFMKTLIGCFEELLVSVDKRLIVLDGSHNLRECLCVILFLKRLKHGFKELNSLYQLLETFHELWSVDMVCFLRSRHEFQWRNGHFKKMEITLDHCYFSLGCFCPANLFQASFVLQKKNFRHGCIPHPMSSV